MHLRVGGRVMKHWWNMENNSKSHTAEPAAVNRVQNKQSHQPHWEAATSAAHLGHAALVIIWLWKRTLCLSSFNLVQNSRHMVTSHWLKPTLHWNPSCKEVQEVQLLAFQLLSRRRHRRRLKWICVSSFTYLPHPKLPKYRKCIQWL